MATLPVGITIRSHVKEEGLPFLDKAFQFYVVLCLRTTIMCEIREVVEIGIIVTKTDNVKKPIYQYNNFVKPSILPGLSTRTLTYTNIRNEDLVLDFTQILHEIARDHSLIGHALENGLLIIQDNTMRKIFPSQCAIEIAVKKSDLSQCTKFFNQWCCLDNLSRIIRDFMKRADRWHFSGNYHRLMPLCRDYTDYSDEVDNERCIDRCKEYLPVIELCMEALGRDLFLTHQITDPFTICSLDRTHNWFQSHYDRQEVRNIIDPPSPTPSTSSEESGEEFDDFVEESSEGGESGIDAETQSESSSEL